MTDALLRIAGVTPSFYGVHALNGVDLQVAAGRITGLIGPNGAGKSTLLKVSAGLPRPSAGSVMLRDRAIAELRPRAVTALGMAYVPHEHNVLPSMTVRENLEMGGYWNRRGGRRHGPCPVASDRSWRWGLR